MDTKLEYYKDKLLLVTPKNRSILLRRLYDKWSFDLSGNKYNKKVIQNMLTNKKSVCIIPNSEASRNSERDRTELRNLYRNTTQLERETGRSEVYLGFPFIQGHLTEDFYLRGPLILFPIRISYKKQGNNLGWYLDFPEEKKPILNHALLQAIKKKKGYSLPDLELFTNKVEDLLNSIVDSKKHSQFVLNHVHNYNTSNSPDNKKYFVDPKLDLISIYLNELTKLLKEIEFPVVFDNYDENYEIHNLYPISLVDGEIIFPESSSLSNDTDTENNEDERRVEPLHLVNYVIIGNFPQGESSLYLDYEELLKKIHDGQQDFGLFTKLLLSSMDNNQTPNIWETNKDKLDNVNTILHNDGDDSEHINLDEISPNQLNLAIESDASQDNVILSSQHSDCTVVRGPPGTGKSQIIINLISNALANHKKVLVICQKKVALDVVLHRLDKIGLSNCVALLHDPVLGRSDLYRRLSKIIEFEDTSINLNIINTELNHYSQSIKEIIQQQKKMVNALKDENLVGISINQLYSLCEPNYQSKIPELSGIIHKIKHHMLVQILDKIESLEYPCKKFDKPQYSLSQRKDFSTFGINERENLIQIIDKIVEISKEKNQIILIQGSIEQQIEFLNFLKILYENTSKRFFRLLPGSKHKNAHDFVKKELERNSIRNQNLEDKNNLKNLYQKAELGTNLWEQLFSLSTFMNDSKIKELVQLFQDSHISSSSLFDDEIQKHREAIVNEFYEIQNYDKNLRNLNDEERYILNLCKNKLSEQNNWKVTLEKEIYLQWINYIENVHPDLKGQPFDIYINNRNQLSKLIKQHQKRVVRKIIGEIQSSIIKPDTTLGDSKIPTIQYNLWTSLMDELNKKSHILPIRKLIEKYESPILKVAPCWLATPEAVSSIFPLKQNIFDLIIFDEASQTSVEKSLPAIYRGKKIVVIGDEKQLRPFDLFRLKEDYYDDYLENEDRILLSESLLLLCRRMFNYSYLKWHYRSDYQELINFSNFAFYDGKLKVAPNIERNSKPIIWISCRKGEWVNRANEPEAKLVVDEVKKILLTNKKSSIGIITLNSQQHDCILDEIDKRRLKDREFNDMYTDLETPENPQLDDRPFVKNIENVQGDERDIIIFSIGYAQDYPDEEIRINFGSINQAGGENRLNVAITRARKKIIIICSFDPYQISTEGTKNEGPKRLKEYLCYAKEISSDSEGKNRANNILSSIDQNNIIANRHNASIEEKEFTEYSNTTNLGITIEKLVSKELTKKGYIVDEKVGYSDYKLDLAIVDPDDNSRYILGIECDGNSFLSAGSIKERDVTRQEFLNRKGWNIERIWSKNWWLNSEKEIERIQHKIQKLCEINIDKDTKSDSSIEKRDSNNLEFVNKYDNKKEEIDKFERIIKDGEHHDVEFKSSLIWDYKMNIPNKEILAMPVFKTITGFMNAEGGLLIIGVEDDGTILGLERDFHSLNKKKSWDEWIMYLYNLFNKRIGKEFIEYIKVREIKYQEKIVAYIEVKRSTQPVFILDSNGKADFYVRIGNSTLLLNSKESFLYIEKHWKNKNIL